MIRAGWILVCLVAVMAVVVPMVVMAADGSEFDRVVSAIESSYHARAQTVPMMGLVSMVALGAPHGGVGGLQVAEFDDFRAPLDGDELNGMVGRKLGPGWERVIRDTSLKGNEQTLIFMHPEGARMGVFVVDLDGQEMDVVEMSVDPDHLGESIGKYTHSQANGKKLD